MNETEEQRRNRLEKEKERSRLNRAKKRAEKDATKISDVEQVTIDLDMMKTELDEAYTAAIDDSDARPTTNETVFRREKNSLHSIWPESISHALKEGCLQKFINQMSMSALAKVVCTICNIRCAAQKSKRIPLSKIPNTHLLKVPTELKSLLQSIQSSNSTHLNEDAATAKEQTDISVVAHSKSDSFQI